MNILKKKIEFLLILLILITSASLVSCFSVEGTFTVGALPICGDGVVNTAYEDCDILDGLQDISASDFGYDAGVVGCYSNCTYDISGLYNTPSDGPSGGGGGSSGTTDYCTPSVREFDCQYREIYNEEFCEQDTIHITFINQTEVDISLIEIDTLEKSLTLKTHQETLILLNLLPVDFNFDQSIDLLFSLYETTRKFSDNVANMTINCLVTGEIIIPQEGEQYALCGNNICEKWEKCYCFEDCPDYTWLILLGVAILSLIVASTELYKKLKGKPKPQIKQLLKKFWYFIAIDVLALGQIGYSSFSQLGLCNPIPFYSLTTLFGIHLLAEVSYYIYKNFKTKK